MYVQPHRQIGVRWARFASPGTRVAGKKKSKEKLWWWDREGGGHDLRNARGDSLPNLNQGANLWSGGRHTVTGRWIHQKMVSFKLYKFAPKGVLPTRPQYRTERGRSCREQQRDDHHYDNDYVEPPLPNPPKHACWVFQNTKFKNLNIKISFEWVRNFQKNQVSWVYHPKYCKW